MIKVFGHKSPDTDSTGSPIIWAWYLTEVKRTPARPCLLGEPMSGGCCGACRDTAHDFRMGDISIVLQSQSVNTR